MVFLSSLAGTLLGALGQKEWIPIAVALGSVLNSLLFYEALNSRLAAVNAAIQDLTMIQTRWSSYGVVEKRTRSVKAFMVEVTEQAVTREAQAYNGGMGQASMGASSEAAKEGEENDEE